MAVFLKDIKRTKIAKGAEYLGTVAVDLRISFFSFFVFLVF